MKTRDITFYSDGIRLQGAFYLPDDGVEADRPLIIPNSGFTGLRHIHPERFARSLTRAGYPCLAFDYRGFRPSDGAVGRVFLEEQVRDIAHAAWFARGEPEGRDRPVVLLGWGMAGGLVLDAAHHVDTLAGLICVNGFYDARRVQEAVRSPDEWARFQAWLLEERTAIANTDADRPTDPFWIYPLDPVSKGYVDEVLREAPNYEGDTVDSRMADSLLAFRPEARAGELDVPLLICHGDDNQLHPVVEAESLFAEYGGTAELFWLQGAGHTEFMDDDNPKYKQLAAAIVRWLGQL